MFVPVTAVQFVPEPSYRQTWFSPPLLASMNMALPAAAICTTLVFVPVTTVQFVPEPSYRQTWFSPPLLANMNMVSPTAAV